MSVTGAQKVFETINHGSNFVETFVKADLDDLTVGLRLKPAGIKNFAILQHFFLDLVCVPGTTTLFPPNKFPSNTVLIEQVGTYLAPYVQKKYEDPAERMNDYTELIKYAEGYPDLATFLGEALVSFTYDGEDPLTPAKKEKPVILTTIHQAKGLEWTAVFLVNCTDGQLPSKQSFANPDALEEERRLFYVACTRAKDSLVITYPEVLPDFTGDPPAVKSRFLVELEHENVLRVNESHRLFQKEQPAPKPQATVEN
jgi:DNA helicase-2/ATP-dependent DNA helicase PcrA